MSASLHTIHLVYLCANVGPRGAIRHTACPVLLHPESSPPSLSVCDCRATGSVSGQTACPIHPTLHQSQSCHGNASPLCPRLPISAHPTGLDECLFFISLVSDFLVVRFSVSSGYARRRSVSTYTAILFSRDCLYSIVCSCHLCQILIDYKVVGLLLSSPLCFINLYTHSYSSIRLF